MRDELLINSPLPASVWVDALEIMQLIKITSQTLKAYRKRGIVAHSKLKGGKTLYDIQKLKSDLERNRRGGQYA